MKSFSGEQLALEGKDQRKAGFTLVELLVVMGLLSLMAFLVYPAYLGSSRSYSLTDVKSNLQQNARLAMKGMVTSIEAGMVVIPEESDEATADGNNYGYDESNPYKIASYAWNSTSPNSDNDKTVIYAALPTLNDYPMNPATTFGGQKPLLYMRRYRYDPVSPSWEDPVPSVRPEVKITQLNFILGGDNQDKVLVTLELAQEDSTGEWRTYKLVSAAKLGAR